MATHTTAERPDIVLIHSHDLGRWTSVDGVASAPTPQLQRFADEAVVFENAHAAAPLCSPARGSLFTGLAPHRHGIQGLTHLRWRYRSGVKTLPERLSECGYQSTLIGLQHEHADSSVLGFDNVRGAGFLPRANAVAEDVERYLSTLPARTSRSPLLLTAGLWEVHRPWPAEDYPPADPAKVYVPAYLPDNADTREDIAAFHGSIQYLDTALGRMFAAIDRHLDPETTLIIFTTDHGVAFPRAKGTLYDAGTGVSLIIRPPAAWGSRPHSVSTAVSHVDLVPTLLDIAGGVQDPILEGTSLKPQLLSGGGLPETRAIVTEKAYHNEYDPIRAVRTRDFAYIRNFQPGPRLTLSADIEQSLTRRGMGDSHLQPREMVEFYDRRADPDELTNVADDELYASIVSEFSDLLDSWMIASADPLLEGNIAVPERRTREVDSLEAHAATGVPTLLTAGADLPAMR